MAPRKTEKYTRISSKDQNQDYGSERFHDNPNGDGILPEGNGLDTIMSELSSSLIDGDDHGDDGVEVKQILVPQNDCGKDNEFSENELTITADEAIGGWCESYMVVRPQHAKEPHDLNLLLLK